MLSELASSSKAVGIRQSRKAIRDGRASKVFLAFDADPAVTGPLAAACVQQGIPVDSSASMAQLGRACSIAVGAAVVALLG